jgi:hypothetical protein
MKVSMLLSLWLMFASPAEKKPTTFSGSVTHRQHFTKTLPDGLIFELSPQDCGWTIDVHPQIPDDASYTSGNAPLHGKNPLNLDDSYDGDWESPLKAVHTVYFAHNHQQAKQQMEWEEAAQRDELREAEQLQIPESDLGKLSLKVTSYRKIPVPKKAIDNPKDSYCATDLHFSVEFLRY